MNERTAPISARNEPTTASSRGRGRHLPCARALAVGLGLALLAWASTACAQTVVPQQKSIGFSAATIGTSAPETLVAEFAVSGYASSFTPTAKMHYGYDYTVGAANCTSTGAGTETCSFSIAFTPTLPGMRKNAILVGDGTNTLATVLVYGVGHGPLAAIQPGVLTQVPAPVTDLYDSVVDENATAYFNSLNTDTIFSYTKAGALTQLPVTGLSEPDQIAIDGAGTLYFSQEAYGNKIVTYSASGVQGAITVQPSAPYVPCANGIVDGNPIEFLSSVAVDGAGDVFVIEALCNVIFELKADGTYATFPIDPMITQASKLAVDDAGNVFIGGFSINELTAGGVQTEINTRENMASVIGNTDGLGVDASGLLYNTPYPGTINGVRFGVAELPPSDYTTPELDLDAGAPLNGIGLGADGTFFGGGFFSFTKIDRSQGALTFGLQNLGVASAAQTVQLVNIGNEPLTISNIALTGDTDFATQATGTMDCANGMELAPSAYCQIAVTLTPAHAGNSMGSLVFTDNSQNSSSGTQIVSLNGYVNGAYVTASPSPLVFAPQQINTTSPAQTVTLTNNAVSGTATIGTPTSSNAAFVPSLNNCSAAIAPGATCQMLVTFTPSAVGSTSGTITASVSGGAPGETVFFGVSGTGIVPPASLNIAEVIHTTDAPVLSPSTRLSIAEVIHTSDAPVLTLSTALNIAEVIHSADATLLTLSTALSIAEVIHTADAPVLALSTALNVAEVIHTADIPLLTLSTALSIAEVIHTTDAPLLTLSTLLNIAELIHTMDADAENELTTPTQTLLSSSVNPSVAGQTVTFTATVSSTSPAAGAPAGTVQFSIDGASTGAPEPLNAAGQATYSTGALPDGQSSIIAVYSGGSGFTGSIAAPLTQSVLDFVLLGGPTKAATVFPGQSAAFEFTIAPQGAFSSPVIFSASGLPPGATASFNPQSVTPSAAPTTVVLTIQTAKLSAALRPAWPTSATPALLLGILLPALGVRRMRRALTRRGYFMTAIVSLGIAAVIGGCGGGFFNQPPKTYSITVTASSGALQHSTTVNLTVQ